MKKIWFFLGCFYSNFANAAELPQCDDSQVYSAVMEQLEDADETLSPLKIRKNKLLKKYTADFAEIDISGFNPREDFAVSDLIMELKMNQNYKNEDFRLCQSKNKKLVRPLYVLIYRDKNGEQIIRLINKENSSGLNF